MAIGFDQIASVILTPGVYAEFDPSRAVQGLAALPQVALITGQMLSSGTATPGQMYAVTSVDEAIALFGSKSQLAQMVDAWKDFDSLTETWCCASAADSGTAATGSITWTGTATENGELLIYIGGRRVSVPVLSGDDAATLETNALAALALVDADLPVATAGNASTGVDFTAEHEGTIGNQIMLGVCLQPGERVPAGFSVTVTPMSSGATDPAYTGVVTAMSDDQYHTIAIGTCTDTVFDAFETELESRWGPMRQIEGHAFGALYDTRANLTTFGNARNSQTSTIVGGEANALLPLPWELAAQTAAISAVRCKVDPSRAPVGQSYSGFNAAPRGSRFSRADRDILLSDGISTVYAGSDGRLRLERLVTTWQTNAAGNPDESYQDLHPTVRTLAAIRYTTRARISSRYGQHKLTDDGNPIPPGQPIVTPSVLRAEMIGLFQDWQDLGWVENLEQFKAELLVERDGTDPNRVNILLPPDLINMLLVTAIRVAFKR